MRKNGIMQEGESAPVDESSFGPVGDPRDERPQYVMPLVVRLERDAPPQRTDALETAARAVLTLLSDPRSAEPDGEWAEAVLAWQDARIRKVVRRARGAEWRRAETLPGITLRSQHIQLTGPLDVAGPPESSQIAEETEPTDLAQPTPWAEVRVYPPIPLDAWPKDLARLQVSGTDFGDTAPPAPPLPGVPVIWMNPAVEMTAGKAMAQAGHAAQLGWWRLDPDRAAKWREDGFPLAVRTATPEQWAALAATDLPMVRDAGFTEVAPGSATAIAELER